MENLPLPTEAIINIFGHNFMTSSVYQNHVLHIFLRTRELFLVKLLWEIAFVLGKVMSSPILEIAAKII